ncbi:hypothetical protein [Brevundimonas sp.]|uniref:hypothetical protein n=1 Tax=Brevundimonas sp. TaxID=1871086 RepID=UPI002D2D22BC|nr:hypothetical protein [Brevundimonas sp.]HYC97686.1 hypothetical protein [Brevundimonas sp.]
MGWIGAVAGLAMLVGGPSEPDGYAGCLDRVQPLGCIVDLGLLDEPEAGIPDLIAAGAEDAARLRATSEYRNAVGFAARVAHGERPSLSPAEAQQVLAIFSEVEFYDSGLPGDVRARWLWSVALGEPVADLETRERLIRAAHRADRPGDIRTLILEAPLDGAWTDDQRAGFASLVARIGGDWRAAEAWLASGGERADGYHLPGVRLEIDHARLKGGYDADAAGRVVDAIIDGDEIPLSFDAAVNVLTEVGATVEMRRAGAALVERGRDPGRSFEDRSEDLGSASMLFEGAGDREAALSAAREGAALAPRAIAQLLSDSRDARTSSPAKQAQRATRAIRLPVLRLYRLGARDEALANGYLAGRDRYLAELDAGRRPDPAWITQPGIDFELKLVVPALARREAKTEAADLLARLEADQAAWAEAGAEERMMVAAIAGDPARVDAIFAEAVRNLDGEDAGGWSAIQLVIGRRAADATLVRDQSP